LGNHITPFVLILMKLHIFLFYSLFIAFKCILTTFFTTQVTRLVLVFKETFGNKFWLLLGLFLVFFADVFIIDDEPLWEPIEWSMVQPWILSIFMFGWIAENLVVNCYGSYAGCDKRVWSSWYKTFWLIDMWFVLSFGVATLFVIVPLYYEVYYLTRFTFSWWNWYSKVFFSFSLLALSLYWVVLLRWAYMTYTYTTYAVSPLRQFFTNYFAFPYSKRELWTNLVIPLLTISITLYVLNPEALFSVLSPRFASAGTGDSVWRTLHYWQDIKYSTRFLNYSKTVDTIIQCNNVTKGHPTVCIRSSPLTPFSKGETLVASWTNNVSSVKVREFIKGKPGGVVSPYIDAFQSPNYNIDYLRQFYDPNLVLNNYNNNIAPNAGSIIYPTFDIIKPGYGKRSPFTFSDWFFHLEKYQHLLWEKTEAYEEFSYYVNNGPNDFKHFDPNNAIIQHFLAVNDATFAEYLNKIDRECLEFKDFNRFLPLDVVKKTNLTIIF